MKVFLLPKHGFCPHCKAIKIHEFQSAFNETTKIIISGKSHEP